ncbi:MAG: hypothetical protein AAF663_02310 [Planctomycetota bacterium]
MALTHLELVGELDAEDAARVLNLHDRLVSAGVRFGETFAAEVEALRAAVVSTECEADDDTGGRDADEEWYCEGPSVVIANRCGWPWGGW